MKTRIQFLLLSCFPIITQSSTNLDQKIYNMDISNQFNSKVGDEESLTNILSTVTSQVLKNGDGDKVLEIDVSSSVDEMNKLLSDLYDVVYNETSSEQRLDLHIVSRMNSMNKIGFTNMIKTILNNEDNTTNSTSSIPNTNVSNATNKSKATLYIKSIDVSLNNIGEDDSKKANKEFLKSIRSLLESSSSCPTKLYFNSCGLDSQFCRTLAKVSYLFIVIF